MTTRATAARSRFPYPGHRTCDEWLPPPERFVPEPVDLKHAPSLMEQRAESWRASC